MHRKLYHMAAVAVWLAGAACVVAAAPGRSAGCVAPNTLELDTLADKVVEITEKDLTGDVVSVDTVSGGMLVAEMLRLYDSVSHCAVATIDTVTDPAETPQAGINPEVPRWHIESTLVKIDTVLKGTFPDSFWQVDTISDVVIMAKRASRYYRHQSYSRVEGETFLFFGDTPTDLRHMGLLVPGGLCEFWPRGFFVDDRNMITKATGAYNDSSRYPGIEVALGELVDALTAEYSLRYVGHLIECLVNPCPGFTVTNIRTGEASMAAAVYYEDEHWENAAAFLDDNSYFMGYFDTRRLQGWSIWSTVFVVRAVLPSTPVVPTAERGSTGGRCPALGIRRSARGISPVILVPGDDRTGYNVSGRCLPASRLDPAYH